MLWYKRGKTQHCSQGPRHSEGCAGCVRRAPGGRQGRRAWQLEVVSWAKYATERRDQGGQSKHVSGKDENQEAVSNALR
ncbi:Hypothetical predicted protein, partial [Marmota monax]